jgi:predicted secreted protein
MKKTSILLLAAIVSLFFAACGGSPSTPEAVAEKYLKASLNGDYGTMKKLASEDHKKDVEKSEKEWKDMEKDVPAEKKELMESMKKMTPKAEAAEIGEDGNTASVKVSLVNSKGEADNFSFRYKLIKENDAWKVNDQSK